MTSEKFISEVKTLKKFYELYCMDKHQNQYNKSEIQIYKDLKIDIDLYLCKECFEAINYSFTKLQNCPHETKPRCRNCPKPCYEKDRWKSIAKVMKYSAIKLSLGKIKSRVMNLFN
ncbi:nitrous oxide-stimulated promoter family protein [Aliarcobacter skirrowii]|uniref:nitrous oxide-stimulated promoter family protein n=1 Tax=Aliarcobacter skirrowii TaxID=28200 RepID=UPI0029AC2A2D|nr:nitrous oxide-stimulated promoter family protein [Aliarcobacter skirrowii]MDX4025122.1 nitrous oxide-stimulated promoter family protein [Aliarcobacter skirrowii]